jgi:hypothetical protein
LSKTHSFGVVQMLFHSLSCCDDAMNVASLLPGHAKGFRVPYRWATAMDKAVEEK